MPTKADHHGIDVEPQLIVHLDDERKQAVGQQPLEGFHAGEGKRQFELVLNPAQGNVEREEHEDIGQDTDCSQRYQASSSLDHAYDQAGAQKQSTLIGDRN